jgi:hypothetical protein
MRKEEARWSDPGTLFVAGDCSLFLCLVVRGGESTHQCKILDHLREDSSKTFVGHDLLLCIGACKGKLGGGIGDVLVRFEIVVEDLKRSTGVGVLGILVDMYDR